MTSENQTATLKKRTAITRAAAEMFVRHGYDATSMDLIAAAAQVSRQTIYNQFENKEKLFRTIISSLNNEAVLPLAAPGRKTFSVRDTLLRLARSILATSLRPATLAVHRLVVAEAARFPELGPSIYAAGAAHAVEQLAEFLRQQTQLGRLDVRNPSAAAEQFFGMVKGFRQFRALVGVQPRRGELDASAEEAVDTFLRAFKVRTKNAHRLKARLRKVVTVVGGGVSA
jgi:TetR/AcrR family transcriptional regulator, mexJK operon transcriptional repressor